MSLAQPDGPSGPAVVTLAGGARAVLAARVLLTAREVQARPASDQTAAGLAAAALFPGSGAMAAAQYTLVREVAKGKVQQVARWFCERPVTQTLSYPRQKCVSRFTCVFAAPAGGRWRHGQLRDGLLKFIGMKFTCKSHSAKDCVRKFARVLKPWYSDFRARVLSLFFKEKKNLAGTYTEL